MRWKAVARIVASNKVFMIHVVSQYFLAQRPPIDRGDLKSGEKLLLIPNNVRQTNRKPKKLIFLPTESHSLCLNLQPRKRSREADKRK